MNRARVYSLAVASLALGAAVVTTQLMGCRPPEPPAPPPVAAAPSASAAAPVDGPPFARRENVVDVLHGVSVADPYRWLEDAKSAETATWLASFDGFTRKHLARLAGRDALDKRLTELSYVEWVTPPIRRGTRYFWTRQPKDQEKAIYFWSEGKTGEPKVLLDPNKLSADGSVAVKGTWPSYDGKLVAYKLSENNKDESTLYVMDVASGKRHEIDTITGAKYAVPSWEPKGKGFYYTYLPTDPAIPTDERPGHADIRRHELGTDPATDAIVHPKTGDPKTFIDVELSRDGNFLFVGIHHGWTWNEVVFRDLRKDKEFALRHPGWFRPLAVTSRRGQFHYEATAHRGRIFVMTDEGAPHSQIRERIEIKPGPPQAGGTEPPTPPLPGSEWRTIVPEHEKAVLTSMRIVGDHLALQYLENASSRLEIRTLAGALVRVIETPGIGTVSPLVGNPEDDEAYYSYESFTTPLSVYGTSVKKGGKSEFFAVVAPIDASPYEVEQVWFESKDKTPISMFVVRRKDMKKDGSTPFWLTGYGGFNISKVPAFFGTLFAWLEKGGGFALPNLRGGGEYGEDWHRDGMLTKKQNVFDDFAGAAEWLTKNGYTKAERLAISGGSNGGLLVGAAVTQRPELFRAAICAVPLLDMVRYHAFGSGRTWISEYGSSEDAAQFKALYAYSPYHHVDATKHYPAFLMLAADSDDRVDPLHARKFAAEMVHATGGKSRVLLRLESNAGHGGGDMIKKNVARLVDQYSFMFDELGMNAPAP